MTFVDANILLRFLTKQPPDQAEQARQILERGAKHEFNLVVEPLTLAEVIYVLSGVYNYPIERIKSELLALLSTNAVRLETTLLERAVIEALSRLTVKLDFPDTYLAARARLSGGQVVSFDEGFDKLEVDWLNPGEANDKIKSDEAGLEELYTAVGEADDEH